MATPSNADYLLMALRHLEHSLVNGEDLSMYSDIADPDQMNSVRIDFLAQAVNMGLINADVEINDGLGQLDAVTPVNLPESIDLNGANQYHILASVNGSEPRFYEMKADDPDMAIDKAHMNFKHLKGQDTTFEVDAVYVVGPRGDMIEADWESDTRMYMR